MIPAMCADRLRCADRQLVDFAHVAPADGARDDNVLGGLRALRAALAAACPDGDCDAPPPGQDA